MDGIIQKKIKKQNTIIGIIYLLVLSYTIYRFVSLPSDAGMLIFVDVLPPFILSVILSMIYIFNFIRFREVRKKEGIKEKTGVFSYIVLGFALAIFLYIISLFIFG